MNKQNLAILAVCLVICLTLAHLRKQSSDSASPSPGNNAPQSSSSTASKIQTYSVAPLPQTLPAAAVIVQNQPAPDSSVSTSANISGHPLWEWRAMATTNLQATLAEAMKLPEGDARNQVLTAICLALAQTDPADAVQLAQALNLDQQPGAAMENLVQQWATSDTSSALQWVSQLPAGAERDSLMTRVAYAMSQTDPSDAANLVMSEIPAGPAQDPAILMVLQQWAPRDLPGAIAWIKNNLGPSNPGLQQKVLNELQGIANYQQN